MKIISWNVNGIRSNIVDFTNSKNKKIRNLSSDSALSYIINKYKPDIICFQETRLGPNMYYLFESEDIKSKYPYQYWSSSKKEGARSGNRYSGTSIWSSIQPVNIKYSINGLDNKEGRIIQIEFDKCIIINTYVPNAGSNWDYRINVWDPVINNYIKSLGNKKPVIYCGDNNIANKNDVWFGDILDKRLKIESKKKPINEPLVKKLTRLVKSKQKFHEGTAILCGYSKQERDNFAELLQNCDMIDSFRVINPRSIDTFSWFNIRIKNCFKLNKGWRIDRFLVNNRYSKNIKKSSILSELGTHKDGKFISDHLPIFLDIDFSS